MYTISKSTISWIFPLFPGVVKMIFFNLVKKVLLCEVGLRVWNISNTALVFKETWNVFLLHLILTNRLRVIRYTLSSIVAFRDTGMKLQMRIKTMVSMMTSKTRRTLIEKHHNTFNCSLVCIFTGRILRKATTPRQKRGHLFDWVILSVTLTQN